MKPHKLVRFTQKLYTSPLLVSKDVFESITTYLDSRNSLDVFEVEEKSHTPEDIEILKGEFGVIKIHGPLTYRTSPWQAMCGGQSYESILTQANYLVKSNVKTIILDIDSGGGEAYGAFLCADELRDICDSNSINLIAYVDGLCCSAAYAIACAADEVIANPYSETGSIGVLVCLRDVSKAMDNAGVKNVFVTAGDSKIPYKEDGTFKPEFLVDLQEKVNFLYSKFIAHVSKYTGLSELAIKETEARTFVSDEALEIGLINSIMTNSEFAAYIAAKYK